MRDMVIDEEMAQVIMGALAVSYSEGQSGIVYEIGDMSDYNEAENRLVRVLKVLYPEVVAKYNWLKSVKNNE